MAKTKFPQRSRNAPPVRRASWGKRQLVGNSPEENPLTGLPTFEEFRAFISTIRGRSTQVKVGPLEPIETLPCPVAMTFHDANGVLGGLIVVDITTIAVLGGVLRRLRSSDIRAGIETLTVHDEMMKAWRYIGLRMADMVSSTNGPRLYFGEISTPEHAVPGELVDYYANGDIQMGFNLDLKPFGVGYIGLILGAATP